MKSRHGFTLLEVMVALIIISILVAIVLPATGTLRAQGQTATCTANLKALWNAQRSYQSDNADAFILYSDPNQWAWTAALMAKGYLPQPTSAYFCPSFPKTTDLKTPERVALRAGGNGEATRRGTYSHYGYNINHLGSSVRYGGNTTTPARGSQISQPARTILFLDSIYTPGAAVPRGSFLMMDRPDSSHVPDPRHAGRIQVIFVDGHVEAFKPENPSQLYAPYPAGLGHTTQDGSLWKR